MSKYIRSPGQKSYKVCVMPYRKHHHRVRHRSGLDFLTNFPDGRGSHRVYLYDEIRCAPTGIPLLRAHLPDCIVQMSLSIMEREREHRQTFAQESGLDDDVKEEDGELSSAEELRILTKEMAGFHSRL